MSCDVGEKIFIEIMNKKIRVLNHSQAFMISINRYNPFYEDINLYDHMYL